MSNYKEYLLSAYAVKPNSGSEPGLGWEWLKALDETKKFKITLITDSEFKDMLDKEILKLNNCKVLYINQPKFVRKICWNQGSWSFYLFYRIWQIRAMIKLLLLNKYKYFDIIHHLNMIGYREPGCLWFLKPREKFIVGPLGGLNTIPNGYLNKSITAKVKSFLNLISFYDPYVKKCLKSSDVIFSANSNSKRILENFNYSSHLLNETGVQIDSKPSTLIDRDIDVLWVGKMVDRKMPDIFFEVSKHLKNSKIVAIGDDTDINFNLKKEYSKYIDFKGIIPRDEVFDLMCRSKILLFPSIDEGTPWVVLEAMSKGVIVLSHNLAGMKDVIPCQWQIDATGFNNSCDLFLSKIFGLLSDNASMERNSKLALIYAAKSSWKNKINEFLNKAEID